MAEYQRLGALTLESDLAFYPRSFLLICDLDWFHILAKCQFPDLLIEMRES